MRIASYNIHDCIGVDKRYDPERIAIVLAELQADIIAIQEVTLDDAGDLIACFEDSTRLTALDGALFPRGVGRYGNLLLCRYPIHQFNIHDLSVVGRESRGVMEAWLRSDEGSLRVLATHLGLKHWERKAQVSKLMELVADDAHPTLLLGDFNSGAWPGVLSPLTALGFSFNRVRSFPTRPYPLLSLDHIMVRAPLGLRKTWRHDTPMSRIASDHYPVLAECVFI